MIVTNLQERIKQRREYFRLYSRKNKLKYRWRNMRQRCNNPQNDHYQYYGGRGIRLCSDWENDYDCFERWALQNGYHHTLQIHRIDWDGNYTPENCRFVTREEHAKYRRGSYILSFEGKTQSLSLWARELGVSRQMLHHRLKCANWSIEKALTLPLGTGRTGRPKGSYRVSISSTASGLK